MLGLFLGCSSATHDSSNTNPSQLEIASVIDTVNFSISKKDCYTAYSAVEPVYNSANSTNAVRMAMASTYGCFANLKIFTAVNDLAGYSSRLQGSGFFEYMAQEFPSVASPVDDKIPNAAEAGMDALMASIKSGIFVLSQNKINSTTNNPGSIIASDRTTESNAYLIFLSMALMGSLQNRYGSPDSSYKRTAALPWTTADTTLGDGCAYASAILNFKDAVSQTTSIMNSNVGDNFRSISSFLTDGLDNACAYGCTLICFGTGVSCSSCPTSLRDRNSCTGVDTDINSCAAAGIITFVNATWEGTP